MTTKANQDATSPDKAREFKIGTVLDNDGSMVWVIADPRLHETELDEDIIVREVLPGEITITKELARAMLIICARFQNEGCVMDIQQVASELERVLSPEGTIDGRD